MRTYAIGDIHGHIDPLRAAHDRVARDRETVGDSVAPVVHLGDLVDRGPQSSAVIDFLLDGLARGQPWVVLQGNHDRYFQRFLETPQLIDPRVPHLDWLDPRLGGAATLASYGIDTTGDPAEVHRRTRGTVPEDHRSFLASRPHSHRRGDLLFVHAGIRPGIPLESQEEDDLVWIREPFLTDPRDHGPLVVHGHTAIGQATHYGNRVNLDSSMAFGGHLTVAVFEGRDAWVLTDDGRVPLLP